MPILIPSVSGAQIEIGGGKIDVVFEPNDPDPPRTLVLEWIMTAARAVTTYYGRYPVAHAVVRIRSVLGDRIESGRTFGTPDGGQITIAVGRSTTKAHFDSDWLMTHEMVHLRFPSVPDEHHWIEEGLATYVEPIARARIGNLRAERVWSDVVRDLPKAFRSRATVASTLLTLGGRTYWGGALFCLLADVEIHRRTGNSKGLEDALRGVLQAGGSIAVEWDLARALRTGDRATGVPVLQELCSKMRAAPPSGKLDQFWKQLGIERRFKPSRSTRRAARRRPKAIFAGGHNPRHLVHPPRDDKRIIAIVPGLLRETNYLASQKYFPSMFQSHSPYVRPRRQQKFTILPARILSRPAPSSGISGPGKKPKQKEKT